MKPFDLTDMANKDIEKYGKELAIVKDVNDGTFGLDILTVKHGEIAGIVDYARGYFEHELPDLVNDAWNYVCSCAKFEEEHSQYFCYRIVSGWTHDMPALIFSLTEYTLYFRDDTTGEIEVVKNSIDDYECREGHFCVLNEDYEPALRQVEDHDERGIER